MRLIPSLITLALAVSGSGYMLMKKAQESNPDSFFTNKIAKISDLCKEATPYLTDDERNSKTVMETVTFREPKYARLLKEAQEVLGISEAADEFEAINKLRLQNRKIKNEITELKQKRIMVPKDSSIPFTTTQVSINKDIESRENDILENNVKIDGLKSKILNTLAEHNFSLQEKELDYFLISAEGDDLLTLMTIAGNMKRIQELIEKELASDPNNVQLAKSYTGMYLISLDAYANAHHAAISNINGYRQKLESIFDEAKINYNEAIRLKMQSDSSNIAHIESNIALNTKALDIIQLYDGLLERRIANLRASQAAINNKVKIARNTYKTLDNGSMLINLVANATNEYSLLVNFEMPELKNIYDTGMLTAFMDISEKIKDE